MLYLNNYHLFNESKEVSSKPVRSERLLTQAQKESTSSEDVNIKKSDILPAILFTDIVGSSEMWSEDSFKMMQQLKEHHELVVSLSEKNKGWVVKTIGDAFMIYFEASKDSLNAALRFSKELILKEKKYELRIGICQGMMQEETYRIQKVNLKDFYGNPVNTASRMESKVAGGPGIVAFTTEGDISTKQIERLNSEIGQLFKVDLSKYDLKGAQTNKAFKIKIK